VAAEFWQFDVSHRLAVGSRDFQTSSAGCLFDDFPNVLLHFVAFYLLVFFKIENQ